MAKMYTISCNGSDGAYTENVMSQGGTVELTIACDGDEDNDSFTMQCYGDKGFVVEKNRCVLTVKVSPNLKNKTREYTIYCVHSNDKSVTVMITIAQEADVYGIELSVGEGDEKQTVDEKVFASTPSEGSETCTFNVDVTGGRGKFMVKSIIGYEKDDAQRLVTYPFDRGLEVTRDNVNKKLTLTSYGRPFVRNDRYYEVTLCHFDDMSVTCTLRIEFSD